MVTDSQKQTLGVYRKIQDDPLMDRRVCGHQATIKLSAPLP
jgi:hypothetical protein